MAQKFKFRPSASVSSWIPVLQRPSMRKRSIGTFERSREKGGVYPPLGPIGAQRPRKLPGVPYQKMVQ